jgi:hypothetical protein
MCAEMGDDIQGPIHVLTGRKVRCA